MKANEIAVRLDPVDVVDAHEVDTPVVLDGNAPRTRGRRRYAVEQLGDLERELLARSLAQAIHRATHRFTKARFDHRFQQIVDGLHFEGTDGMLVVRGDE